MKRLVEEILNEMDKHSYVPSEADAQVLIAWYLRKIAEGVASKSF